MRVFIAIELEEEIKDYLLQVQNETHNECKSGNFTPKNNFHLTLRFMGDITSGDIELLKEAIYETSVRNKKFSLKLSSIGFFQKPTKGLLWCGVQKSSSLLRLFSALEKNLSKQGFSREKQGLSPHITMGREVVPIRNFDDVEKKINVESKEVRVSKITLMESVRLGSGLIYRPLFWQELK